MHGLFEGACTIKPGQKWLRELFKGAVFSRARSDQGNTVSFSCGAQLQDCEIPDDLMDVVYIRKLQCNDPVEKLLLRRVIH